MEPRTANPGLLLFQSSYLNRRYLKISIFLLVGVLMLIGFYHEWVAHQMSDSSYFTVILDCGSTGTRIHVYEWLRNGTRNQDQPIMLHSFPNFSTKSPLSHTSCEYHCMQTEPGLDKFLHNTSGVSLALDPLLLWAEHQIPSERHGNTPIFLLATAGLRRLPSEDADWILDNAESVLKKHGFMYRRSWIRVLSGKEEAYYGWIALNYNLGRLGNYSNTSGVLDLGGSSMQVVMEREESRDDPHFLESKIGSVGVRLLAYSVPAFGLNEAFERSIVLLGKELGKSSYGRLELKHPCLNSGFAQNYSCHGCYGQPNATNKKNLNAGLLDNQSTPIHLVGDPDWEQCKELARATVVNSDSLDWLQLSSDMGCKARALSNRTSSLNTAASHHVAHFHALSGFFAVYKMLDLNPRDNMTLLLERGKQLCSRPWEELKRISGDRNFVEQLCFRPPYLAALIEDGLCLGDAEISFGPGDVSWTLGAALVEADFLWSIEQRKESDATVCSFCLKNLNVMSAPYFFFVLILCLIFVVCYGRIKLFLNPISSKKGSLPTCIPKKTGKLITR